MQKTNYLFLLACVLPTLCFVACTRRSPEPNRSFITIDTHSLGVSRQQQFREALSKRDLPIRVLEEFTGGIADSDQAYFETDVGDSHLPRRRLLVAGISSDYCLVNYEYGGIAHGYLLILFSLGANEAKPVWIGGSGKIKDLNALKIAVESGKLVQQQPNVIW